MSTSISHRSFWLLLAFLVVLFSVVPAGAESVDQAGVADTFQVAVRCFEAEDFTGARHGLTHVLKTHANHGGAHLYLGRIALVGDERDTAKKHLKRAVDLEDSSPAHLWYGRALLEDLREANMFAKAAIAPRVRRAFEIAVEKDPSNIDARYQLGNYYLNAPALGGGSKTKARQQAEAIVPVDPQGGHAFLARILSASSDVEGAIREYREALKHNAADKTLHYQLGLVYQQAERWDEAFAAFEDAVRLDAKYPNGIYQIGRTGALSGRNLERAAEMMELFIRELATPSTSAASAVHWRLGMIRQHQGDVAAAGECYRRALELDPDLREAREALRGLEEDG